MQWAIIPSSVSAIVGIIILSWRLIDTRRNRPRVRVLEYSIRCAVFNGVACERWQAEFVLENESPVEDVLRDAIVTPTGGAPWRTHRNIAGFERGTPLKPRLPIQISGDLRGPGATDPIAPGTAVKGAIALTFSRARPITLPFEFECKRPAQA